MNPEPHPTFTAAAIATALGIRRQSVQARLDGVTPSGILIVKGVATNAWSIAALPQSLCRQLSEKAPKEGYRNAEQLLLTPPAPWEPPMPLAQIAQPCLDKAAKLQRALLPSFPRANDQALSAAEFERLGVEDYRQVFGHAITDRYFRELFKRTIDRDGGREQWNRLELFLDEKPARKPEARPAPGADASLSFQELREVIAGFNNPADPTETEVRLLWLRAFECYEVRLAEGKPSWRTKRELLAFLFKGAPFLAGHMNALRMSFERKYERWVNSDRQAAALADGRKERSGNRRAAALSPEDKDTLIGHATLNCGGRVSQAWRELRQDNGLSETLLGHHIENPASKSYVPHRIREAVKHEVAMLDDIHHGPRKHRLDGAHIHRDWSGVAAGDWYQADDITLPVYFYEPDGQGGFRLTRGQCLLFIDLRSTRILQFCLIPEKQYNAHAIRATITKTCDEHGLPRKGFYFERGIWQSSRLLKGDQSGNDQSWGETELGLRELGLQFTHAQLARSKPVERVIGAIQNLMEGEPGYVGRNEMIEKFERIQRAKMDVENGKVHPGEHFYSFDEWVVRFTEICAEYNSDRQDGEMTGGLSPDEAWQKYDDASNPPIRLNAQCRYLLANHKRPVKVTKNGITLRFGKQTFTYRGKETASLVGQIVLAWFDPSSPEILAVTDMNRKNPFTVARAKDVPAMNATEEQMHEAMAQIAEQQAYAKVRYRTLRTKFARPSRRNLVDADTAELGRNIQEQRANVEAGQKREQAVESKARKISRELQMPVRPETLRRPEAVPALERLHELLAAEDPAEIAAKKQKDGQ